MKDKHLIAAAVILLTAFSLHAGEASPEDAGKECPAGIYSLDMTRETILFTAGAAVYGANYLVRGVFPAESAEEHGSDNFDKDEINVFDRWAVSSYSETSDDISDALLGALILSPMILTLDESLSDTGVYLVMYAETLLLAQSVKELVKSTFTRYRPYNYSNDFDYDLAKDRDSAESFFSGHTTIAFASASFLSTVYSKIHPEGAGKYWVMAAAYGGAATTGILRVASGMHFPTDVLAGAVWGTFTGIFIPALHEVNKESKGKTAFLLYPSGPGSFAGKISF